MCASLGCPAHVWNSRSWVATCCTTAIPNLETLCREVSTSAAFTVRCDGNTEDAAPADARDVADPFGIGRHRAERIPGQGGIPLQFFTFRRMAPRGIFE